MKYLNYRYYYPPRPKNAIPQSELEGWDNGTLLGQPKMNGSNTTIFTNNTSLSVMNRHNQRLTNFQINQNEISQVYRGNGWIILNGEYMNKSKRDENDQVFNHKFVIFDILAFNGEYLVGSTFEERVKILDSLYGTEESEKYYLYKITDNIYRVKSYETGFNDIYEDFSKIDMLEGLVMKRKNAKLELGLTENNNTRSQIKIRKPTKLYKF